MLATARADGVLRAARPGTRWLATTPEGGYLAADAAYNVTVPEGFDRTDLAAYARERRRAAGFGGDGPTLLTGVAQRHARGARAGPVTAVATAGLSNPAALPMAPDGTAPPDGDADGRPGAGTVNLLVATSRALDDGGLATLLATAVEAKAATLLSAAGVPRTTSDAAVVGCDPGGDPAAFAGSATAVGSAARACVREAVAASLSARYAGEDGPPASVADAEYGAETTRRASVFRIG
ncbi:MAG: adenosylcobinamide amidohydrolase [Haloarculaceae archaeon]